MKERRRTRGRARGGTVLVWGGEGRKSGRTWIREGGAESGGAMAGRSPVSPPWLRLPAPSSGQPPPGAPAEPPGPRSPRIPPPRACALGSRAWPPPAPPTRPSSQVARSSELPPGGVPSRPQQRRRRRLLPRGLQHPGEARLRRSAPWTEALRCAPNLCPARSAAASRGQAAAERHASELEGSST